MSAKRPSPELEQATRLAFEALAGALEHEGDTAGCSSLPEEDALPILYALVQHATDEGRKQRPSPDKSELLDALAEMVYQFGYDCVKDGQPAITTGGLSALEDAFEALGWDDPYVIPDPVWCDAPVEPRCPHRTTSGTPTSDGYKRYCRQHFPLWQDAQKLVEGEKG